MKEQSHQSPTDTQASPPSELERVRRTRAGGRAITRFFVWLGLGIWLSCAIWVLAAPVDSPRPEISLQFRLGVGAAVLSMLAFYVLVLQRLWTVELKKRIAAALSMLFFFACWGGVVALGFLLGSLIGVDFKR